MRYVFVALAMCAGAASAQSNPITGAYGNANGCAVNAGRAATGDDVFLLTPQRIERHESSCAITRIATSSGQPSRIDVSCSGEGETWTDSYAIAPLAGADGYVASLVDYPAYRTELRPCR